MALDVIAGPGMDVEEPDWELLIAERPDGLHANLRKMARREWSRVCGELRDMQTLAAVNRHAVQRLVLAYIRYDLAAAKVLLEGEVVGSPNTGVPQLSMWQVAMRQADSDATTAEMELCLNPRRRGAATKVQRKTKRVTAADSYLKRAGG
ncbi:P27 family phage terminase small subunit [Pseudoroseomonas ludipueritiae]|uniref:P27 family phage terminase small subunit n=1 Tax=Pseudoroseomonas ludipueritiae TaxID=198093 RepID=A0ABR7R573_9PROT|nr:P27 family phage terminase small subunit [Pseudoroseomonas ludipueritiae]MBC9176775.1 P27 family phage terminase small subunit [Pseudoroseomonas ludipueritiae]